MGQGWTDVNPSDKLTRTAFSDRLIHEQKEKARTVRGWFGLQMPKILLGSASGTTHRTPFYQGRIHVMSFDHLSGFNSINNILKAQQRQADAVRSLIEGPAHVAKSLAAIPATIEKIFTQSNRLPRRSDFQWPSTRRFTSYIPVESHALDARTG